MKRIISFVKSLRLKQVLTVFFAGTLLFLNTACSGSAQAKMPTAVGAPDPHPVGQRQPYEGGMNNYSDTAPGQAVKGTAEKTKALIDRAEKDISTKSVNSVDQYVENYRNGAPIQDRVGNIVDNTKEVAGSAKNDVKSLGDRLKRSGEDAVEKTKELGERLKDGTANVSDNLGINEGLAKDGKREIDNAGRKAARAADDAAIKTKRAINDAID
jgi:hypothetical protein